MPSISAQHLDELDLDIARAERLIRRECELIKIALQSGANTVAMERRIRKMHAALSAMQVERGKIKEQL